MELDGRDAAAALQPAEPPRLLIRKPSKWGSFIDSDVDGLEANKHRPSSGGRTPVPVAVPPRPASDLERVLTDISRMEEVAREFERELQRELDVQREEIERLEEDNAALRAAAASTLEAATDKITSEKRKKSDFENAVKSAVQQAAAADINSNTSNDDGAHEQTPAVPALLFASRKPIGEAGRGNPNSNKLRGVNLISLDFDAAAAAAATGGANGNSAAPVTGPSKLELTVLRNDVQTAQLRKRKLERELASLRKANAQEILALGGPSGVRTKALAHEGKKRTLRDQISKLNRLMGEKLAANHASLILVRKKTNAIEALEEAVEKQAKATSFLLPGGGVSYQAPAPTHLSPPHQGQGIASMGMGKPPINGRPPLSIPPTSPPSQVVAITPLPPAQPTASGGQPLPPSSPLLLNPLRRGSNANGGLGVAESVSPLMSRRSSLVLQIQQRLDAGLSQKAPPHS